MKVTTLILFCLSLGNVNAQSIEISHFWSALLDIRSTNKGLLTPRMSTPQINGIINPAKGLLVYDSSINQLKVNKGNALVPNWQLLGDGSTGANTILSNLQNPTAVNVNLTPGNGELLNLGSPLFRWRTLITGRNATISFKTIGASAPFNIEPNTSFGFNVMRFIYSGGGNTAMGEKALTDIYSGNWNTAIGSNCLTEGDPNYNTGIGSHALLKIQYYMNTGIGADCMKLSSTGVFITAIGFESFKIGNGTTSNTGIGVGTSMVTSGNNNTAVGTGALYLGDGSLITAIGVGSLQNIQTDGNTSIGYNSLFTNISGYANIAIGVGALQFNLAHGNSATGAFSLFNNASGKHNMAGGDSSLFSNTTGNDNSAFGSNSQYDNVSGVGNTANGCRSLYTNTTGTENVASGFNSMENNTSGAFNTASGSQSLRFNTIGYANTACGAMSLYANTTGFNNSALGKNAGASFNGSANTLIGAMADISADNINNATAIGYATIVDGNNKVRIGNSSVNSIGGQVGWSTFSDARIKKEIVEDVPGLSFINELRPVCYYYNIQKEHKLMGITNDSTTWAGKHDIEKINFSGLLAQEVDAAARKINYDFSGVDRSEKIWSLRYTDFIPSLIKAEQELSNKNDTLQNKINDLIRRLEKLEGTN